MNRKMSQRIDDVLEIVACMMLGVGIALCVIMLYQRIFLG